MYSKKVAAALFILALAACVFFLVKRHPQPVEKPPLPAPAAAAAPNEPLSPPDAALVAPEGRAPADGVLVQGVVKRSDTGDPVTEFELAALEQPPANERQIRAVLLDDRVKWRACQSAEGAFTVEPPQPGAGFAVGVRAEGFAPSFQAIAAGQSTAEMMLSPLTTVTGVVETAGGVPIPKAAVLLGEPALGNIVARSGPDGRFQITGFPPGEILLTGEHPDYAPASVRVTPAEDQVTKVTITLRSGGRIEGAVTRGGQPLDHAFIIAYDGVSFVKHARTDSAGRYRVDGVPAGEYQVECQVRVEGIDIPLTRQLPAAVEVDRSTTANFDFPRELGGIGGVVVVNGEPAGGGKVRLVSTAAAGNFFSTAVITGNGEYRFENVMPGEITLEVHAESAGGVKRAVQRTMTLAGGETVRHDFNIEGTGAIAGKIENAGRDVSYRVLVFAGEIDIADLESGRALAAASLAADETGGFRVDGMAGGVYTVVVMAVSGEAGKSPEAYADGVGASSLVTVQDSKTSTVAFSF